MRAYIRSDRHYQERTYPPSLRTFGRLETLRLTNRGLDLLRSNQPFFQYIIYINLSLKSLLETDNRIVIPIKIPLRLIRKRPGIFFGQCSEICGINHRFIPIIVESTSFQYFLN